jgi:hypothetical protein
MCVCVRARVRAHTYMYAGYCVKIEMHIKSSHTKWWHLPGKFSEYENTVYRLKGETKSCHILVKTLIEFHDEKTHWDIVCMLWQMILMGMWLQHYKWCFLQGANWIYWYNLDELHN